MSRIDEALRRASGAGSPAIAGREEHPDQFGVEPVLHHYPRESGAAGSPAEAPERLTHRTIDAPRTGGRRQLAPLPAAFEGKLVVSERAKPVSVEQYRRLAGAVHELQVERGLKTLMVTSALPNEGKTLTISNLALTLSESYQRRVLLIDADLRRPFIHQLFQVPNAKGLSDVLRSETREIPLLQVSEHLSVLTAGHSDSPMAGLTSDRMRVFLEQSAATFDWVLLDAPPVGFMADAQLLAGLTRAVLFVIEARSTPHSLVSRAIAEIGPECIVGTVLNRVEDGKIPATGYYHDYYYEGIDRERDAD